jgi:ferritin
MNFYQEDLHMLISKELNTAINEQIGHEFQAAHQYANIACYFDGLGLKKLGKVFIKQSEEEHTHGMKFIDYIIETGGTVAVPAVVATKAAFESVEEAVQLSLDWEWEVTRRINALMALAIEQKDYAAQDFLRWFVTEQVEEISTMDNMLKIVRQAGPKNLIMLEAYFSHAD